MQQAVYALAYHSRVGRNTKKRRAFSAWTSWRERDQLPGKQWPGVYVIARSRVPMTGRRFSWCREIIYVGMTNSRTGLAGRLNQFDRTLAGGTGHGGAHRVRYRHPDFALLSPKLYVAAAAFPCDVNSNAPRDLLTMGAVASFEYECWAAFVKRFGHLPQFNHKQASPKGE